MPDVATAQSVFINDDTPAAIARTVASLTAPYSVNILSGTARTELFISLAYATTLPLKTSELPGHEVIAAATPPPVQLSAVDSVMCLPRKSSLISAATILICASISTILYE
jgi:hypothetical protein